MSTASWKQWNIPQQKPSTTCLLYTSVKAPDGYVLDSTPHRVNLTLGQATTVELYNTSKPGLQIIKKDSLTGQPVGGARFSVVQLLNSGGEKKLGEFTTSQNGTFFIPDLTPGRYVITELQAADGYILEDVYKRQRLYSAVLY